MLTPQQEAFCIYLEVEKLSQCEAYIKAYPAAKRYKRDTVYVKASELANDDKILVRRKQLRNKMERDALKEAKWTRQDAFDALSWLLERAKEDAANKMELTSPIVTAMTKAIDGLNELYGVNDKANGRGSIDDIIEAVRGVDND